MACKTALAAGVLSLILVGAWGKAQAETKPVRSNSNPEFITVLGKTLCAAQAPPVLLCDWRMPDLSKTMAKLNARSLSYGPMPAQETARPKVFRALGLNFCLGKVSQDTECGVKLPGILAPDQQQRVRL